MPDYVFPIALRDKQTFACVGCHWWCSCLSVEKTVGFVKLCDQIKSKKSFLVVLESLIQLQCSIFRMSASEISLTLHERHAFKTQERMYIRNCSDFCVCLQICVTCSERLQMFLTLIFWYHAVTEIRSGNKAGKFFFNYKVEPVFSFRALFGRDKQPASETDDRQRCNSIDSSAAVAAKQRLRGRTRHCSEPSSTSGLGFEKNKTRLLQASGG